MPRPSDPANHRHRAPPPQVGREREQRRLQAYLGDALAGDGRLVLISGEAGIGKTTLVSAVVGDALDRGALVLTGGCHDLTTTPAFGPWVEVMQSYPDDGGLPPLPEQLRAGTELTSIDSQAALHDLVVRFLTRVTAHRPLVLLLEDLHWADPASLDLLRTVARALRDRPALLIGTYRDDEPASDHQFFGILPVLVRETECHRVALRRLDRPAILELVRRDYSLTPQDEQRLTGYLGDLAEGNPFFTIELLYMLSEQRLLVPAGDAWRLGDLGEAGVPPLIQQIVGARLAALDTAARSLLDLAAVIGIAAPLDLLERVFDGTPAELDDAVQQVLDRRLATLTQGQQAVRLSHALVRQAIYEGIPPLRRRRLHSSIADLLAESRFPDAEVIADHLFHAVDVRGINWLIRAAERAQSLFAVETVIARCNQAQHLASLTGAEVPVDIYRLQGRTLETTGDFRGAREAHEMALATAGERQDERATWRALLDLGNLWASRDYERSRTYLEQMLGLARQIGAPGLLGRSFNRLGNWYVNAEQLDEGIRYHQQALNIFERTGDQTGIAATLDLLGMTYHVAGDVDRSAVYYRRAIPLLRAMDDRQTLVTALVVLATAVPSMIPLFHPLPVFSAPADSPSDRVGMVDEAIGIARDIGWRAGESFALALGSHAAQIHGDYDRAIHYGYQAMTIASEIGHQQWLATALTSLGDTHIDILAFDRAGELLESAHAAAQRASSRFLVEYTTALLAANAVACGELDRAEQVLQPRFDISRLPMSLRQRDYCFVLAQLEVARKNDSAALALIDRLEAAVPGTHGRSSPHLLKLRADALIAGRRYAEAEPVLIDALDRARASGFRPLVWRILGSLRRVWLEQGALDRAEEARQAALRCIDDLAANLHDTGVRDHFLAGARAGLPERMPFRASRTDVAGLTSRERQVLALVARGLTDAEAGEELFISPRTVSQHLRSIYTKLDVANRAAAVRVAMEQDLIGPPSPGV